MSVIQSNRKIIPFSDIKPYENNVKIHSQQQIDRLKRSIDLYGYVQPIAVDKNNVIVIGHGRYFALKDTDPNQGIEVIDLSDLPAKKIKKLRILDNKISSDDYNQEALDDELIKIYGSLEDPNEVAKIIEELSLDASDIAVPDIIDDISLPSGDNEFRQMTFKLTERQQKIVEDALERVRGDNTPPDNENANSNALELICRKSM